MTTDTSLVERLGKLVEPRLETRAMELAVMILGAAFIGFCLGFAVGQR